MLSPVAFPPGRPRLSTKPAPTGSPTMAMTMGVVRVAFLTALVAGVPPVTITSTCDPTSSAARSSRFDPILSAFPLEGDGSSLDIPKVLQALHECLGPWRERCRRTRQKDANTRHLMGLLRARRERPRDSLAAEKRDELAPLHSFTSSASESKLSEILIPSALAVLRLITVSNLVGCSTGRSAGFAPLRNPRGVDPILPIRIGDAHAVTQQSARHRIFAKLVDGRQAVSCCKPDDLLAPRVEVRV